MIARVQLLSVEPSEGKYFMDVAIIQIAILHPGICRYQHLVKIVNPHI